MSDKEFEKYRLSLVLNGRARYLDEENIKNVRIRDFATSSNLQNDSGQTSAKPYIGLQHVNKNSKRARYNYMEKAIKIYNWTFRLIFWNKLFVSIDADQNGENKWKTILLNSVCQTFLFGPPPPEKIIKLLFQSGRSKGHNHHQQLKTKNKLVPVDL